MAPRKEKVEKATGDAAVDLILNYLRKQNRPYSATDISANLHNKVTKAAAAKLLKDMHESKQIEGRASGKQWVYHSLQDPKDSVTPEELASMDEEISALREETTTIGANIKSLRSTLSSLESTMSTADLRISVAAMESEKREITARLEKLRKGDVKPVSKEEREAVEKSVALWEGVAVRRGKIVKEMWGCVLDTLPEGVDPMELREQLGLDD